MSISIQINIPDGDVSRAAMAVHMEALGYTSSARYDVAREHGRRDAELGAEAGVTANVGSQTLLAALQAGEQADDAAKTAAEVSPPKKTRGKAAKTETASAEPAAKISANPEDRKPPEDDAETAKQDAADEAAEVEAGKADKPDLTVDDLKGAMGGYVEKFGMPATQQDGHAIFVSVLGAPPAGEPAWKMTLVATLGQDKLAAAIDAWKKAISADKRFGQ